MKSKLLCVSITLVTIIFLFDLVISFKFIVDHYPPERYAQQTQYNSIIEQEINIQGNLLLIEKYQKELDDGTYSNLTSVQEHLMIAKKTYQLSVSRYENDQKTYNWPKEKEFKKFPKLEN